MAAVDKHTGDGVMALFGAKATHEGDPEHAIRAALDMQKEITAFGVDHPGYPASNADRVEHWPGSARRNRLTPGIYRHGRYRQPGVTP